MRIALLSGANAIHTVRWANALAERGHDVHLVTMHALKDSISGQVSIHHLPIRPPHGYFLNFSVLKKLLQKIKPDVLNAHYASGYGTLARLSHFHPLVLNVWGSDVYDFPDKSCLHRKIIKKNLRAADLVASTSHIMAKQTASLLGHDRLEITPFGVDTQVFSPLYIADQASNQSTDTDGIPRRIRIGTVKTLAPKYGIDTLIQAFALLCQDLTPSFELELVIVGEGPDEKRLKEMVKMLGLESLVRFKGRIPHAKVPDEIRKLDIYAALSRLDSESFGVAIVEASSCGKPVVVSDVDGFQEVVEHGKSGYIVTREDPAAAKEMLQLLVVNEHQRSQMGAYGRDIVKRRFEWEKCVSQFEAVLRKALIQHSQSN